MTQLLITLHRQW